jgi:GT2 family glycosyltransferase
MSAPIPLRCYVVIPTYRRPDLLARTLGSIAEARLPESLKAIIVVENAVRDGSEAVCAQYADRLPLRYLFNEQPGRSRAIECGFAQCEPGLVIMFDDDIRVAGDCLVAYERAAKALGPGSYFGGAVGIDFDQPPEPWLRRYMPSSIVGYDRREELPTSGGELRFLGFNMACFTEDFFAAGGMNPNLGAGAFEPGDGTNPTGSEWDLQARLQAHGVKPEFLPAAEVWHYVPPSRCSSEWVLHRAFRSSVELALNTGTPGARVRRLVRKAPSALLRYLLSDLAPSPQRRFAMRKKAFHWAGELNGLLKRRRSS